MFRRETLELGPVPASEPCIQVDDSDYINAMVEQTNKYLKQLETIFPDYEKHDCLFGLKRFSHDFGIYMEVVIYFYPPEPYEEDADTDSLDFAFFVESNLPDTWEDTNVRHFDVYKSSSIAEQFINA